MTSVGDVAAPDLAAERNRLTVWWERFTATRTGSILADRLPLLGILLLQILLSFRLTNTAFEDEALYIYSGHREIALLFHGTPTYDHYNAYFSGAPFLYPVAAGAFDGVWGLSGARALSLALMLGATTFVWMTTRRLYGRTAAVIAAALFATAAPTLFLSRLATFDAPAVFLLALALWIVVSTARMPDVMVLLAAPVLTLAVAVKYASLLFVPTVIGAAVLAVPLLHKGKRSRPWIRGTARGVALVVGVAGLIALILANVSPDLRAGLSQTTTHRSAGGDPFSAILRTSLVWGGWIFALGVVGVFWQLRKPKDTSTGTFTQFSLAGGLVATAMSATAYQAHLHTLVSLHKHVGFGLLFAAPVAGSAVVGLARLGSVDLHRRIPGLALGIGALLAYYAGHAVLPMYEGWPNSARMVATLRPLVHGATDPKAAPRYMVEENEIPRYYLAETTQPYEWLTTYYFQYTLKTGQTASGVPAYQAAIADGYFNLIVLDYGPTAVLDRQIDKGLAAKNSAYHLVARVPGHTAHGNQYYYIWALNR
jgi:4-amino-4-deoxy-L-arabinose transferase-like glycosyltransferase